MPPDMSEWLPPGHLVWFVLEVVEQLDTAELHRRHRRAGPGRAAYDPEMLLALLLYAYAVGERSSRRIERLCSDHVAFRVVCAQDAPDHTTIARFRAVHEEVFAGLFTQVLTLCAQAGMGRLGVVAVDGTKIAANASAGANRTEKSLRAEAERILAEAAAVDAVEDEQFGDARGDELPEELADPAGRRDRIRRCLQQIEADQQAAQHLDEDQRARAEDYTRRIEAGESPCGPPPRGIDKLRVARARLARTKRRIEQAESERERRNATRCYYFASADLKKLEQQAAPGGRDTPPADNTSERGCSSHESGSGQRANVTDPDSGLMPTRQGWIQGFNAQIVVSDDHLILATGLTQAPGDTASFEPMMRAAVAAADTIGAHRPDDTKQDANGIGTILADAGYLSNHNLTADGPDRLIALGKSHRLRQGARDNPACGPPPADASPIEQMSHRLRTPEGEKTYRRRSATVETVIAHLKDQVGVRRFSRRGIKAATSELDLAATVANLLKLHKAVTPQAG
jgi:transposase